MEIRSMAFTGFFRKEGSYALQLGAGPKPTEQAEPFPPPVGKSNDANSKKLDSKVQSEEVKNQGPNALEKKRPDFPLNSKAADTEASSRARQPLPKPSAGISSTSIEEELKQLQAELEAVEGDPSVPDEKKKALIESMESLQQQLVPSRIDLSPKPISALTLPVMTDWFPTNAFDGDGNLIADIPPELLDAIAATNSGTSHEGEVDPIFTSLPRPMQVPPISVPLDGGMPGAWGPVAVYPRPIGFVAKPSQSVENTDVVTATIGSTNVASAGTSTSTVPIAVNLAGTPTPHLDADMAPVDSVSASVFASQLKELKGIVDTIEPVSIGTAKTESMPLAKPAESMDPGKVEVTPRPEPVSKPAVTVTTFQDAYANEDPFIPGPEAPAPVDGSELPEPTSKPRVDVSVMTPKPSQEVKVEPTPVPISKANTGVATANGTTGLVEEGAVEATLASGGAEAKPIQNVIAPKPAATIPVEGVRGKWVAGNSPVRHAERLTEEQVKLVMNQVADRIESLIAMSPRQRMTLRLDPAELGTIELTVKTDGRVVEAHIRASQEPVRAALDNGRQSLQQVLEAKGLQMTGLDIGLSQQHARNFQQNASHSLSNQPQRDHFYRGQGGNSQGLTVDAMRAMRRQGSGVDLWI